MLLIIYLKTPPFRSIIVLFPLDVLTVVLHSFKVVNSTFLGTRLNLPPLIIYGPILNYLELLRCSIVGWKGIVPFFLVDLYRFIDIKILLIRI